MTRPAALRSALAGLSAAVLALGVAELLAGLVPGVPSPVVAIGAAVIELQPPGAKDFVVALFGQNDKLALEALIVGVVGAVGAALGIVARRRPDAARAGVVAMASLAVAAALWALRANLLLTLGAGAITALVGVQALDRLRSLAAPVPDDPADAGRRRLLATATLTGLVGVVAGTLGRSMLAGRAQAQDQAAIAIPPSIEPANPIPPGAALDVPGITPLVVPNDQFYRIDTALIVPSVDLGSWRLTIRGMVDREVVLTFEELVDLPLIERYVTIACVSNEVGGDLVGNAKWTGVRLTDVLGMAGVRPGATQVVPRSVDGWTAGFPTAWVTEQERDALVAVEMNDEPLPVEHGFPARLIVPGLYGYVSATKWLSDIELTTLEAFDAYWVPRGWAKEAPILTQSRIDTPRGTGRVLPTGRVPVAGVAWAPERGIRAVEVSVDDGPWQPARLGAAISDQTWVQWRFDWDATPGPHRLAVRATDGTGEVQTAFRTPPAPDGARGHHSVQVVVG
ncbi:MAG TPA: molybdopterin-dependent oxidoreductase [Candidatus Limnocylindrales bacterium]|nr:molybdopterin-dependent oxidoreductase [Candidatus Limnocylindrales bacterium]